MSEALNAGLTEAAILSMAQQVRIVKARLLMATRAEDVGMVQVYSGVATFEVAAMLLAATDGDVNECKREIMRFWTDKEYKGPFVCGDLPALLDLL